MQYLTYCLLLCTLMLTGCQSVPESQCQVADWERIGFNDATAGVRNARTTDYQEDCGKVIVQPNQDAYKRGWSSGIGQYCTAANGWREGILGNSSRGAICQEQAGYQAFTYYLDAGLRVHHTSAKVSQKNDEIYRLKRQLGKVTNHKEKHRLQDELSDLNHDQRRLESLLLKQKRQAP